MSAQPYPVRSTQAENVTHKVRGVGGATAITQVTERSGVTLSWLSTGTYRMQWAQNPGRHLGNDFTLSATTPANLAGHTVVFGAYDSTNYRLDFVLTNASDAVHDLAALEWVDLRIDFKEGSV